MEILADRIAGFFIRNGVALEENRDIYAYGLMNVFSHGICLVLAIAVGFVFAIPIEMLIFFVPFIALRISAGGYHAGLFWVCIATSSLIIIIVAIIISLTPAVLYIPIIAIILFVSTVAVFKFAPIEDINRPLTSDEVIKFRKRSRIKVIVGALIMVTIAAFDGGLYSFCAVLGFGVVTASIFAAFLKHRFEGR